MFKTFSTFEVDAGRIDHHDLKYPIHVTSHRITVGVRVVDITQDGSEIMLSVDRARDLAKVFAKIADEADANRRAERE